jgi:cobalt/nickel transport system permease protein
MHIPDGYLGLGTCGVLYAAMVPAWALAARSVRTTLESRQAPLIALSGAFSFVMMLFNVPVPGGTTAHAVGGALAAVALGPAPAIMGVSIALAIQALVFGDGGLLALGANCFNMAVIMPVAGYAVFQAAGGTGATGLRRRVAAFLAGYVAVNLGALTTAIELGLQPVLSPGHCPYALSTTVPAIMLPHLLVIGFIEGAVTAAVWEYVAQLKGDPAIPTPSYVKAWAVLGVMCLAAPIGLLAAGTAWGEWAPEDLKAQLGYVPPGLAQLADFWQAKLKGYAVPGMGAQSGYILSGLIGLSLLATAGILLDYLLLRTRGTHEDSPLAGKR